MVTPECPAQTLMIFLQLSSKILRAMKNIVKFSAIAAIAALALVSCSKEIENPEENQSEGIKVTLVSDLATKTYLDGSTPKFKATDAVGVFVGTDTQNHRFDNTKADGAAAEFSGSVSSVGTYYAYYPYSSQGVVVAENGAKVKMPEDQYPTPTSFDGAADLLISESFSVASTNPETINVKFRRLGGFLKFTFTDGTATSKLAGEHATLVSVIVNNVYGDGSKRPCPTLYITPSGIGTIGAGMKTIKAHYDADTYELTASGKSTWLGVVPQTFAAGSTFTLTISTDNYNITRTLTLPGDVTLGAGQILPINVEIKDADVAAKSVQIETVWSRMSDGSTAWNSYFGAAANSDRNIAMDDDYVYVAENKASAALWAISRTNPEDVTAVNVTGVSGGTHALACPRVIKNTNPSVNGGKDVLICSDLTRGGEEPKLYFWLDGIANAPTAVTLVTYATGAWYGDVFTVFGTLQDGVLLFDKIGGDNANGIVTFNLDGTIGSNNYLLKRVKFNDAFGSHGGACAYYPFPGNINAGIYSPGRGVEARGRSAVVTGDFFADGNAAFDVTLTDLDYADGRNGFVLGYNFIEWKGKRYVIYGRQTSSTQGYTYVLEGSTGASWLDIANTASVKFRRDMVRADGCTLTSGNSGMDVTARIIGDDLYIAVQKQNIGCALYRLYYE